MLNKFSKIKVRVDKSHLFTLGEKMYRESIEFIRELVNNAYDADAARVFITISDNKIVIADDGAGMNEKGLEQFFTIGSKEKILRNVSPRFGRKRIGQFGIGKFSALSFANQFVIESIKNQSKYSVIFDRADWEQSDNWELPVRKEAATVLDIEGTKIILNNLTKTVSISEVEKYLRQTVPLRAKKFNVFLNNKKITPNIVAGKTISININTLYGPLEGEIVIALDARDVDEPGIECRVKQVFVKRDLFDLEKRHLQGINKITGFVNADFLPLISSRSDFIIDSPEYKLFSQLIQAQLNKAMDELKKQGDIRNLQKINKELQSIMKQVRGALALNPDFVPKGRAITRLKQASKGAAASASFKEKIDAPQKTDSVAVEKIQNQPEQKMPEQKAEPRLKITARPLIIKRIRLNKLGISCAIAGLGENSPEAVSEGNIIYINQDHPVYLLAYKKRDIFDMHLLRLITQEVVLMKKNRLDAREAFDWQSKLIKDALCENKSI